MIIPSIDLMNGRTVQLVGGRELKIDAGDPFPLLERFSTVGETAVIDLDAAIGTGSNAELIKRLVRRAPCRVGGGIRSLDKAVEWLDAGAAKIIIGTAAKPELLSQLPRERVIAALDSENDEIVVEGWRKGTGLKVTDRMRELRDLVGGFLVTFVEREGRMGGMDPKRVAELVAAAGTAKVTAAGGVATTEDIAALDRLGADAQVGMALYTGAIGLAEAFAAPLVSDRPDGLWPTVVVDERGTALGLAYSDAASLKRAIDDGRGVYHSRKRGLWIKGETSGEVQDLLRVDADCDRDALRFTVRQHGRGFCHTGTRTCWGEGRGLPELMRTLRSRLDAAPPGSYTRRLLDDPALLESKLLEEAGELLRAANPDEAACETADVLYFALTVLAAKGGDLLAVERELDRRALKVTRRPGNAK